MRKVIHTSKNHWGLALGEIFIIFGAVVIGEYALRIININALSLVIALPAIFIGLAVRSYFSTSMKKGEEKKN